MDKDALSGAKKESTKSTSKDISSLGASPLIIILAMVAVLFTVIYLFKDKLFKNKNKNLKELVDEQKQEPETPVEPTKQETVQSPEDKDLQDKFAKQS